jgi:hypothetical protein
VSPIAAENGEEIEASGAMVLRSQQSHCVQKIVHANKHPSEKYAAGDGTLSIRERGAERKGARVYMSP